MPHLPQRAHFWGLRPRRLDHDVVKALKARGFSCSEIARGLNCRYRTVRRICGAAAEERREGAVRNAAVAQDRRFCAAMQRAIDAGLERPRGCR
jgi:hypothetical protein